MEELIQKIDLSLRKELEKKTHSKEIIKLRLILNRLISINKKIIKIKKII